MKKLTSFLLLITLLHGCTKTEDQCSDPAGTVTVNIPNSSYFCFKTGALAGNCAFAVTVCCSDILFSPNNFSAVTSVYAAGPTKGVSSIATTGKASKLCDIKSIPTSGFVLVMAADYDIGYVVKLADGTHARFIVKGFGTFTNGGVSSVQITYQYPFQ